MNELIVSHAFALDVGTSTPPGADQSRIMQEQMSGAAMAMPADTNKAFKVCVVVTAQVRDKARF